MRTLATTVLLTVAALLVLPGGVMAQQGTVAGTVVDARTGETLPGASVQIESTNQGTATGADGQFSLSGVPVGEQVIRVTFVGYDDTERTVEVRGGSTVRVRVQMSPQTGTLEEVVVTGLGQEQTRAEASVSVSSVDAADVTENADIQNMTDLLQGRTSGVTITQASGNVGSGIRFNVRSGVSLNSDGQPLIFIDGSRINQNPVEGFGAGGQGISPLADLDPSNIESIQVLKGPAASALYGTDGVDGVVLIETKSGTGVEEGVRVNYQGTLGYSEKVRDYDSDIYKSANIANNLFREGSISNHKVSASGSFNDTNYFVSYSRRETEGILPNNSGTRNNFTANFEVDPTDELTFSLSGGLYANEYQRPDNDNNIFGQLGGALLAFNGTPWVFTDSVDVYNIDDRQRVQRYTGSAEATYTPSGITGLQLQASVGSDLSSRRQDRTFPASGTYSGVTNGERNAFTEESRQYNGEALARYSYDLSSALSATSTLGAQAFTESTLNSFLTSQQIGSDLIRDAGSGSDLRDLGEDRLNRRSAGIFARQQFNYDNTYTLSGSLRRDYSTRLVAGETDAFTAWYPSVRGTVRLDQFDFVPGFFSQLKLRGAFGQSGALPDLTDSEALRLTGENSGSGTGATIGTVGDPDLESETVSEVEGGIDIGVNNRYTLSATYYYQTTRNSIVDFEPAPSTGFGSYTQPRNVGRIDGQGVETDLNLTVLDVDQYRVDLNANYSYRFAEVKELGGQVITGDFDRNTIQEGLAPATFVGLVVDGAEFNDAGEFVGPNIVDQNDDGVINGDDRMAVGNPRPDHFGGFGITVQLFENLTLRGQAEYQLGHQIYNNTEAFAPDLLNHQQLSDLQDQLGELDPGTQEYRNTANQIAELDNQDRLFSNFVYDADWLKLRSVSVRYDLADDLNQFLNTPLRTFSVGLSGQNLFTFTDYPGPDPEVNFSGSRGLTQGQEFLTLQNSRQFTATLQVGF